MSINDVPDRPPRPMVEGDILDLGGKRVRHIDTPHVPTPWEARILHEANTGIIESAMEAQAMFRTSLAPDKTLVIRRLADVTPSPLAILHGSSNNRPSVAAV